LIDVNKMENIEFPLNKREIIETCLDCRWVGADQDDKMGVWECVSGVGGGSVGIVWKKKTPAQGEGWSDVG